MREDSASVSSIGIMSRKKCLLAFWPTINLGYRWRSNFGLSVAPYAGDSYGIGEVEASDGTVKTFEDGTTLTGFGPSFGL